MNKDELVIVRRSNGRYQRHIPLLKIEHKGCRFLLSQQASIDLELKAGDGLMFGFNYKEKKAYLFKDDEPDSFRVHQKSKTDNGMRFSSKDLYWHFMECFDIGSDDNTYFNISKKTEQNEVFELKISKKNN